MRIPLGARAILQERRDRAAGVFRRGWRVAGLSEQGDPLAAIASLVSPEEAKKSKAGRKPLDALVLVRVLVLQALCNLCDPPG